MAKLKRRFDWATGFHKEIVWFHEISSNFFSWFEPFVDGMNLPDGEYVTIRCGLSGIYTIINSMRDNKWLAEVADGSTTIAYRNLTVEEKQNTPTESVLLSVALEWYKSFEKSIVDFHGEGFFKGFKPYHQGRPILEDGNYVTVRCGVNGLYSCLNYVKDNKWMIVSDDNALIEVTNWNIGIIKPYHDRSRVVAYRPLNTDEEFED